nr:hypothetical protein [Desulfatitalea tepidiphila]
MTSSTRGADAGADLLDIGELLGFGGDAPAGVLVGLLQRRPVGFELCDGLLQGFVSGHQLITFGPPLLLFRLGGLPGGDRVAHRFFDPLGDLVGPHCRMGSQPQQKGQNPRD